MITVKVLRFNPTEDKKPHLESYEIEKTEQRQLKNSL